MAVTSDGVSAIISMSLGTDRSNWTCHEWQKTRVVGDWHGPGVKQNLTARSNSLNGTISGVPVCAVEEQTIFNGEFQRNELVIWIGDITDVREQETFTLRDRNVEVDTSVYYRISEMET